MAGCDEAHISGREFQARKGSTDSVPEWNICRGLESDAGGEFEAARSGTFGGLQCGDGAEAGGVYLHVGRLVVAMVEYVGSFNAELQLRFVARG